MKRRSFLVPFAATVAALLGSSPDTANAMNTLHKAASAVHSSTGQADWLGNLVIERASGPTVPVSQHVSHASHASHASHVSHQSSAY